MRFKTKVLLVAVPTFAVVAAGTAIAVGLHLRQMRRKRDSSFLPNEVRSSLEDLCLLKGEDFVPDAMGTSRFQRKLEALTDRQLIGVYVVLNAVKVLHDRGINVHEMSKQDIAREVVSLRSAAHGKHDRRELLRRIGSFGADTARSMLSDGLVLAGAMQTA